jgi:hypothetical protein
VVLVCFDVIVYLFLHFKILKKIKKIYFFTLNNVFVFLNYFDVLILKINNFKILKYYFKIFYYKKQ